MRALVERRRRGLLGLAAFTMALAAIPGAAQVGERLREGTEVAATVPPASQWIDPMQTGSVDGADTIGAMIKKLGRGDALQAHQKELWSTQLAVIARENSLRAIPLAGASAHLRAPPSCPLPV